MTKNVVHYFLWRMVTYVSAKMLGSASVILRSLAQVLFVIVDSLCFFVVFSIIIQTFFLQSIPRTAIMLQEITTLISECRVCGHWSVVVTDRAHVTCSASHIPV